MSEPTPVPADCSAALQPPAGAQLLDEPLSAELPWPRIAAALRARGLEPDVQWLPRQFAGGHANLNFLIRCQGAWAVLRRPPPGPLPAGAHDMAREHRVLGTLWQAFPLAPRSLLFCDDRAVLDVPFLVSEYRHGRVLSGAGPDAALDPPRCAQLAEGMVATLARLHQVDPRAVGLGELGLPQGFLGRAVKGWGQRAMSAWPEPPATLERMLAWLAAQTPAESATTLLHCDFKLDNLILDAGSVQPIALVDWDMCTRGDPLFDLATLLSYWTEAGDPEVMHALGQMPTALPGFPSRAEVLERYAALTGRSVRGFLFYRVLALLKLAVVFAQLSHRWNCNLPSTDKYRRFRGLSLALLDFADEVRQGGRIQTTTIP